MRLTLAFILATFLLIGAMAYLGRGQALEFSNSSASYVTLGSPISVADDEPLTICYWFYHDGGDTTEYMALGEKGTDEKYIFHDEFGGEGIIRYRDDARAMNLVVKRAAPGDLRNKWLHFCLVINEAVGGTASLDGYLNGVEDGQGETTANSTWSIDTLGNAYNTDAFCWNGKLADVRIYTNRAFTAKEVAALYHSTYREAVYGSDKILDMSMNGKDGTAGGSPVLTYDSADDSWYGVFGGPSDPDYYDHPTIAFADNTPWTVTYWFYNNETGNVSRYIMGDKDVAGNAFISHFEAAGNDKASLKLNTGAGDYQIFNVSEGLASTNWHMATLTCDGATTSPSRAGYLDKTQSGTGTFADDSAVDFDSIGRGRSATLEWDGKITAVRFYGREISATEVTNLFDAGRSATIDVISQSNLLAFYDFKHTATEGPSGLAADTSSLYDASTNFVGDNLAAHWLAHGSGVLSNSTALVEAGISVPDGGSIRDFSGNNNTGTATNGPVTADSPVKKGKGH